MLRAEAGDSRIRPRTKTQLRMSRECPGQRPAGLGRRQPQPRPLCEIARKQLSRYRKAEQTEIPAVRNFERLRGVDDCQISRSADLLMAALGVATDAIELEIDKIHIAEAARDVRAQTHHHVLGRLDTGNLD